MSVRIRDHGWILQRVAFRESSLVVRLFTRDHGKQTVMARGVRQNHRDGRRAALAGLHTLEVEGSARSASAMLVLTRVDIVKPRYRLLQRPETLLAAQVIQESILRLTADADPLAEVFDLSTSLLDLLDRGEHPLPTLTLCLGRMIHLLGYGWRLDGCAACGSGKDLTFFSVKRQQVVCTHCGTPYAPRLLPITPEVLAAMTLLPWPAHTLSEQGAGMLYRIIMNSLARVTGGPLLTDEPFRAMMIPSPNFGSH
ncbi:MAG: DNA repair protein RecO [Magnetococcales bacterium]|nr:DNA repair protein RecO [Magnetococcales bacterium]